MPSLIQTLESLAENTTVETAGLKVLALLASAEGFTITDQQIADFQDAATKIVTTVQAVVATKSK